MLDDPSIRIVAEVMGGVDPAGGHVLALLGSGRSVVTANKQLVARRGAELFAAAAAAGAQLRFEASVCAAIPVIKVLRESLVVTNVHRVVGIVNGTTNFVLTAMDGGSSYDEALAEAQRLGYAEADPTDDVGGLDAAAKIAILATIAFGSRVPLDWVAVEGIESVTQDHVRAAKALDMRVKLLARATLEDGRVDVRVGPAFVDAHHPLATVEGAFNAVMLQGDAIREITLEGPGRGRDRDRERGRRGHGLDRRHDRYRLPSGRPGLSRPAADGSGRPRVALVPPAPRGRPGRRARARSRGSSRCEGVSVARLVQQPGERRRRAPHRHARGAGGAGRGRARGDRRAARSPAATPTAIPVVSQRGVEELGWA